MDAVYEIAYSPAQNQSEGHRTQGGGWRKVAKKHEDDDHTGYAESDEDLGMAVKQAKNGTSIFNVN